MAGLEFQTFFDRLKWRQPFGPHAPGALALFDAFVGVDPQNGDSVIFLNGEWAFAAAGSNPTQWATSDW